MALTKTRRFRAPIDGSTFRTMANLNSLLRMITRYEDEAATWPKVCDDTTVPIFVRMHKYKAQETRETPDGMIYGPVVRIGSITSPEIEAFGHHWSAGLKQCYHLDGLDKVDKWLYEPLAEDVFPPGDDVSFYTCDKCNNYLLRDDTGRRSHHCACIFDGSLVCQDCDVTGLVYDGETEDQLARARKLAGFVGDECLANLERNVASLSRGFSFGRRSQTRLFRSDRFSFNWSCVVFTEDGERHSGMHGGLIQHGPCPIEVNGHRYEFRTWDYAAKAEREATHDEVKSIHWGIHT